MRAIRVASLLLILVAVAAPSALATPPLKSVVLTLTDLPTGFQPWNRPHSLSAIAASAQYYQNTNYGAMGYISGFQADFKTATVGVTSFVSSYRTPFGAQEAFAVRKAVIGTCKTLKLGDQAVVCSETSLPLPDGTTSLTDTVLWRRGVLQAEVRLNGPTGTAGVTQSVVTKLATAQDKRMR